MNATGLQKRVDGVLKRVKGMDRTVYLRTVTSTGGDALTGRDTFSSSDTLLSPPPTYRTVTTRDVVFLTAQGVKASPEDYLVTLSGSSITKATFENSGTQLVLKDASGDEEVLRIIDFDGKGFQGQTVIWSVVARSV